MLSCAARALPTFPLTWSVSVLSKQNSLHPAPCTGRSHMQVPAHGDCSQGGRAALAAGGRSGRAGTDVRAVGLRACR